MNKKTVFVLVLILVFASLCFAQYEDIGRVNQTYLQEGMPAYGGVPWIVYGIIAVVIAFMISGIVYIIAYALDMENIKRWAQAELFQAAASAVLVILLIFLLDTAVQYTTINILGGKGAKVLCAGKIMNATEPIEFAKCKVQEKITILDEMYEEVYENNLGYERAGAKCWSVFGITVRCGDWSSDLRERIGQAHLLGNRIIPVLTFLHAEWVVLDYIAATMLVMFLPLGILFRIFPYTRGVGGLLIAIAVGFYFIFPILSVMIDPSYTRQALITPELYEMEDMEECYVGFSGTIALMTNFLEIDQGGLGTISYRAFANRLSYLTIEAFYIPFMALAVTLIFIRILALLFGAEPSSMMRLVSKVG
ncbi:hypothetical protein DRN85_04815 [Methanosarcinales archaeon]|nr:MAG: hypothetical protein DRN85_04815 [Methanosarcinales archaeon]